MVKSKEGKEISKMNAVKHGLYFKFSSFFPCNLCVIKDKCEDYAPGGNCSIDSNQFNRLMKKDVDELEVIKQLISYNQVRLMRATEQLYKVPQHIELSRISGEIRNLIQTYHIIKNRKEVLKNESEVLQSLPKQSKLSLLPRE
ncbi:MAG: hypothetical protein WC996_02240 [Peptostreptococcales bacterium]|nr:hypothetical protein [Candidatus ainarchaeum sp.]